MKLVFLQVIHVSFVQTRFMLILLSIYVTSKIQLLCSLIPLFSVSKLIVQNLKRSLFIGLRHN